MLTLCLKSYKCRLIIFMKSSANTWHYILCLPKQLPFSDAKTILYTITDRLKIQLVCNMCYHSNCSAGCHVQDPQFWTYRPLTELMVRAAADDVRFLPYIYHNMMKKLNQQSLWYLAVRGALYCRCFCINENDYVDWPPLPPVPGFYILSISILL